MRGVGSVIKSKGNAKLNELIRARGGANERRPVFLIYSKNPTSNVVLIGLIYSDPVFRLFGNRWVGLISFDMVHDGVISGVGCCPAITVGPNHVSGVQRARSLIIFEPWM
jgi:hypothetical protein